VATVDPMSAPSRSIFDASDAEVTIDLDAQAVYVRLRKAPVVRTKPWNEAESIILDLDTTDDLVGIEVLGLNTEIPIDELSNAFDFSEPVIRALKELKEFMWQASVSVSRAETGGGVVPIPMIRASF
jgi:uncharacterized protein YuzE